MLINERHFKQHWLRQSVISPQTPPNKALFFCRVAKTLALDLETSRFQLLVALAWTWNGFIGFSGFVWSLRTGVVLLLALCLQVLPSDYLVSLHYGDPARKGEVVLVPPTLSQCPWHAACGYCLISYCWQLKHKHIVTFLDGTGQTLQNSLCMQICMLSERHTCTWNLWKMLRDLKGNSLGSCLIFLNINPQTVSLNIPHVCVETTTWQHWFSLCLLILGFFLSLFFSLLFFASLLSCLLHLLAKPSINMYRQTSLHGRLMWRSSRRRFRPSKLWSPPQMRCLDSRMDIQPSALTTWTE